MWVLLSQALCPWLQVGQRLCHSRSERAFSAHRTVGAGRAVSRGAPEQPGLGGCMSGSHLMWPGACPASLHPVAPSPHPGLSSECAACPRTVASGATSSEHQRVSSLAWTLAVPTCSRFPSYRNRAWEMVSSRQCPKAWGTVSTRMCKHTHCPHRDTHRQAHVTGRCQTHGHAHAPTQGHTHIVRVHTAGCPPAQLTEGGLEGPIFSLKSMEVPRAHDLGARLAGGERGGDSRPGATGQLPVRIRVTSSPHADGWEGQSACLSGADTVMGDASQSPH